MHSYHEAQHYDAELYGNPGALRVRITGTDSDSGTPDYKAAYVPIVLGPFKDTKDAQAAFETFLIALKMDDVAKKHTYRCNWCEDWPPIENMTRVG
jgi:hypothetical protein